MSAQPLSKIAPISPPVVEPDSREWNRFDDYCRALRERHDILTLVRHLGTMINAVQLHRGMSMSLLAGNSAFQPEIEGLQRQLEQRLTVLEVFTAQASGLLSAHDRENLHNAWHTIRHDWHDDAPLDNFELHSHFVEQLLGMVAALGDRLAAPLLPVADAEAASAAPPAQKQLDVIDFTARQLPRMMEMVAQIRGLATHAASLGRAEYHLDRKLRFLVQCARAQNQQLHQQATHLDELLAGGLAHLGDIKTYELKLLFLFNAVVDDVLGGGPINTESQELFRLATEIVSVYSQIMNEGWSLLRQWLDQDVEQWVARC